MPKRNGQTKGAGFISRSSITQSSLLANYVLWLIFFFILSARGDEMMEFTMM